MSTQDDDLMAMLTDEERAAMADDDADADTRAVAEAAKAAGDDDGDDDAGAKAPSGKETPAQPVEPEPEPEPDPEPEPEPASRYDTGMPSDYDEQIKVLKAQDAEFRQKYKDGDIDIDERDEALAGLSEQREQLLVAKAKAATLEQINVQSGQQQWQRTINTFMSDAAKSDGGIDYRKDADKAADLDTFVKALGNNPAHADKPMDWFLQEGHRRVQALHGMTVPTTPAAKAERLAAAIAGRKPPVGGAPKTLAQVPGSDGPGDIGDPFADVLALDGQDYEDAIARMTPVQRAKFMQEG